jgi:hypothetical protein
MDPPYLAERKILVPSFVSWQEQSINQCKIRSEQTWGFSQTIQDFFSNIRKKVQP